MDSTLLFSLLLLPEDASLAVQDIQVGETLTVRLSSTASEGTCSGCGRTSTRLHSRYSRTLSDLPVSGRRVRLVLQVRRFFCPNSACPLKTFAERFPELTRPHAQRTLRLQHTLEHLGLALGGEAGARQGQQFGFSVSADSLLRLIRQRAVPAQPPTTHIGLDDWAYKRKLRYGTLICDLDTGEVLDLLPDRSVQTVSTWLQAHPEVELISRDRWSEYATAAQKAAPQATQVADRWHLLSNLVESLTALLARCRPEIRQASGDLAPEPTPKATGTNHVRASSLQTQRHDQFAQVHALSQQGLTPVEIAARVGLGERTVYRWLARPQIPDWHHRFRKASVLDPYKAYVLKRWQEGCRQGVQLLRELQAQGYRGSTRAIYSYLAFLNASRDAAAQSGALQEPFSAKRAVWLLIQDSQKLDAAQQQHLAFIRQASAQVEQAYQLAQAFTHMLRHRQGQRLEDWLQEANMSGLPELRQFAAGIRRDKAAVQAGLTLSYSNGLVEGHINRLKLIKRSMYGRANFDLLRQRVLFSP
jgi:transposase